MNKRTATFVQWLVILAMPFALGLTTMLLAINPAYPRFEYARANFPRDPYGFSQQDRLELSLVAVGYLRRPEPAEEVIYLLEEQRLPGTDQPLYNQREIGHMIDVKNVVDGVVGRVSQGALILVVAGVAALLVPASTRREGYRALMRGGLVTAGILLALALFITVGWNLFFVLFHEILFPPDTWSFPLTDSLIRLFPEQFFFDWGVLVSISTLVEGVVMALAGYWLGRRARS